MKRFYKYQGTGNDFIIIDDRENKINLSQPDIAQLCHRRFGIGADGLMLLQSESGFDFRMIYFNSDGRESSMCGNGGRCITAFAAYLGIVKNNARFLAIDGAHEATILHGEKPTEWSVSLKMQDVEKWEVDGKSTVINTGSPHYTLVVDNVEHTDVFQEGRKIRNNSTFKKEGINVNFVSPGDGFLRVRTYERGVEDETYSCGTGVTAVALSNALFNDITEGESLIETKGGSLSVRYKKRVDKFTDIWLTGPAELVFTGEVNEHF